MIYRGLGKGFYFLHVRHLYHQIMNRSGRAPGSSLTSPSAFPQQREHKLPEMKLSLPTVRTRNNREHLNNDGVLFSSTVGEQRPSDETDT